MKIYFSSRSSSLACFQQVLNLSPLRDLAAREQPVRSRIPIALRRARAGRAAVLSAAGLAAHGRRPAAVAAAGFGAAARACEHGADAAGMIAHARSSEIISTRSSSPGVRDGYTMTRSIRVICVSEVRRGIGAAAVQRFDQGCEGAGPSGKAARGTVLTLGVAGLGEMAGALHRRDVDGHHLRHQHRLGGILRPDALDHRDHEGLIDLVRPPPDGAGFRKLPQQGVHRMAVGDTERLRQKRFADLRIRVIEHARPRRSILTRGRVAVLVWYALAATSCVAGTGIRVMQGPAADARRRAAGRYGLIIDESWLVAPPASMAGIRSIRIWRSRWLAHLFCPTRQETIRKTAIFARRRRLRCVGLFSSIFAEAAGPRYSHKICLR